MENDLRSSNESVSVEVNLSPSLQQSVSPVTHFIYGTVLTAIGTAGILGNGLVLIVFTRYRRLKGPFSCFIINLAIADLITSFLHFMAAVSSFQQQWIFGSFGCQLYAASVGHFGLLSIVTLAAIAVERFMVITAKPLSGTWKMTQNSAKKVCVMAWIYCLLMTLPPLFGWSQYILEGFLTSCSWDYMTRTPANRAYYIYLLIFGFAVPVFIITYCYTFILITILAHGKEMANIKATGGGGGYSLSSRIPVPHTPARSTVKTAEIILTLVVLFLIAWTPYAVVTLIGQFGNPLLITPWVSALPALFAKASVVYNPIVYSLSHPHFRSSVMQYISSCTTLGSDHRTTVIGAPIGLARENMTSMRAVASSPTRMGHLHSHHNHRHHHLPHHVHFRCFPARRFNTPICTDYHSEPDPRGVAVLLDDQGTAVTLRWTDVTSAVPLANSNQRGGGSLQNTSITSEALVTVVNSQSTASGRPTVCLLYNTLPKQINRKSSYSYGHR